MAKSAAFARIKADVLAITRTIPPGQVSTFRAIGLVLEVMPRHVAYILANLSPPEQAATPWYRVVSDGGRLEREKRDAQGRSQAEWLAAEGIVFSAPDQIASIDEYFFAIDIGPT